MEKLILTILKVALKAITPELRSVLGSAIQGLRNAAKGTPSQWDDMFVEVLAAILGLED